MKHRAFSLVNNICEVSDQIPKNSAVFIFNHVIPNSAETYNFELMIDSNWINKFLSLQSLALRGKLIWQFFS